MKDFNSKVFKIILALGLISVILSGPYVFTITKDIIELSPENQSIPSDQALYLLVNLQAGFYVLLASFFGTLLYKRAGFSLPVFERPKRILQEYKKYLLEPVFIGVLTGFVIVSLSYFLNPLDDVRFSSTTLLMKVGASFYGGVVEELLTRFFLVSLFVIILSKFKRVASIDSLKYYIAIILAAILFGVGHLPLAYSLAESTVWLTLVIVFLNSIGGIVFGYLYWKRGLFAAIVAHFMADIMILIIWPWLLSF